MNDVRMWWFHVNQFRRNSYFTQLLFTSTLSILIVQALAARNPNSAAASDLNWLRAGMLGAWTMCAVAVGLLNYQRHLGTLVHLVRTPYLAVRTLFPAVGAASVFGLAAFPIAALGSRALGMPVALGNIGSLLIAALLFWLACVSVSTAVGMFFVLSPDAFAYESLIGVPIVLVSGVFGTASWIPNSVISIARILPTRAAVELLTNVATGGPLSITTIIEVLLVSLLWLALATLIANKVTKRATVMGTLEVI
ncbi:MAG: ABC transporter permease [Cellulomonadaceae bacterium]|jgi:ABC-2 type transport system permease protein|nr:ABC transporter permease [Cellulomonadaceae bacterium]